MEPTIVPEQRLEIPEPLHAILRNEINGKYDKDALVVTEHTTNLYDLSDKRTYPGVFLSKPKTKREPLKSRVKRVWARTRRKVRRYPRRLGVNFLRRTRLFWVGHRGIFSKAVRENYDSLLFH